MKNRKVLLNVLLLAVCSLLFSGYSFAKDPVKIGLVTSLSGAFAPQGEEVHRAIQFAIEEANNNGGVDGRQVEVQVADDESTPDGARRGSEKLARSGHNLLIGPIASSFSLTISQNLDRWDAIYFVILSKNDKITGEGCQPRMFRVNPGDSMDLTMMKSWLESVKEKKFSILAVDYIWGRDSAEFFQKTAKELGKEIDEVMYPPMGTKDFAPYISKLNASGSDAVWVALIGRDIISFAKQAQEFGLRDKMRVIGHAFIFNFAVNAAPEAMAGIWGNIGYSASIDTPKNKTFVEAWKKKFNREPTENEGQAYNGVQAIFSGVTLAGSTEPQKVADALSGATLETIFGPAEFRAKDHQMLLPNYIGQVKKEGDSYKPVIEKTFDASIIPAPNDACQM
ncbi:MAG: branched-chain amino acid ABC transporter substrate-binding protein [Deltaproteobacteria bacterium]|nr:MAG: branched-chain amino acid ABC transporter substrate-binding protein [Deltaproteobacteria bacterium]